LTVVTDPPVFLSRLLGRPVRSSDGVRVGRVVDMTILYDIAHPNVHRLGVGRGRRIRYLLPWRLVQIYNNEEVSLPVDRTGLSAYATAPDPNLEDRELLLAGTSSTPRSWTLSVAASPESRMCSWCPDPMENSRWPRST
jgi:sporulation protein YlmC with PRC-barrel domain